MERRGELDEFVTWAGAHDVPPQFLPAYRRWAERIVDGVEGPIYPRHVDAALAAEEKAGTPPRELANLQRVGDALLRFYADRGAPPLVAAPPTPPTPASAAQPAYALAPRAGAPPREGGSTRTLLYVAAVVGAIYGAYFVYKRAYVGHGDAELVAFDAGRFIVAFHRVPAGCADPRDAAVELTSSVLAEPVRFDWPLIAARSLGRPLDPAQPPPLDGEVRVHYNLDLKDRVRDPSMQDFLVYGRVYWCGHQQDLGRTNVRGQYKELPPGK